MPEWTTPNQRRAMRSRATQTEGCTSCGCPTAESLDCAEDVLQLLAETAALREYLAATDDAALSLSGVKIKVAVLAALAARGEETHDE